MIRERERRPDLQHERPEPAAQPPHALLALQRTAGNQAVGRMLQRAVRVGQPGMATTTYQLPADVATLTAALPLGGMPGWVAGWIAPHVTALVTNPAMWELDTAQDVLDWILLRELAQRWLTFAANPATPAGVADRGRDLKAQYARVEALRAAFAVAGANNGAFTLFGVTYNLQAAGVNHFYVTRAGQAHPVVYGTFTRADARAVLNHLEHNGQNAAYPGAVTDVDNFVCSFLAEPSRWPEEQVFNLLATTAAGGGGAQMVGANVGGTLPMAAGSTWDANLNTIGRQTPKRALAHSAAESIKLLIDQELPNSTGFTPLVRAVAQQLTLVD